MPQNNEVKLIETYQELNIKKLQVFIDKTDHDYSTAHKTLCFAIIARIYKRAMAGYYFGAVKVDKDMIIDGNHRYIAYKLAKIDFEIVKGSRSHCDELKSFKDIKIDTEQDWDANHPVNKRYCTDGFLKKGDYRRT